MASSAQKISKASSSSTKSKRTIPHTTSHPFNPHIPSNSENPSTPLYTIDPTAHVSPKATITGTHPISIGANCVIHPYATLDSSVTSLTIGAGCIVASRAYIGGRRDGLIDDELADMAPHAGRATTIGENVVISDHARVDATASVGNCVCIEANVHVAAFAEVEELARLMPGVEVAEGEGLERFSVLLWLHGRRVSRVNQGLRDDAGAREGWVRGHERLLESLRGLVE